MPFEPTSFGEPGTLCHGTLRTDHLLDEFANELESLIFMNGDELSKPENFTDRDRLNNLVWDARECETGSDEAEWTLNELFHALNEFAPPGHYFGPHRGDGSDFGFWENGDE